MADSRWIHHAVTEPVGELQRRAWRQAFLDADIDLTAINLNVRAAAQIDYTDYMDHPIPLVSDDLLEVLALYQPYLKRRAAVLTDRERLTQKTYWAIHPPVLTNVLSSHTKQRMDGSLEHLVLRQDMLEIPMFQLMDFREAVMIVNLALAESILRRNITGVQLVRLEQEPRD